MMKKKATHYSRQREQILSFIRNTTEHPTAEMVYTEMRKIIPNISLGTVYRNLKFLEEAGKIRKISVQSGLERYDARMDEHAHFICVFCGRVSDLSAVNIQEVFDMCNIDTDARPLWINISFGGICEQCKVTRGKYAIIQYPKQEEKRQICH